MSATYNRVRQKTFSEVEFRFRKSKRPLSIFDKNGEKHLIRIIDDNPFKNVKTKPYNTPNDSYENDLKIDAESLWENAEIITIENNCDVIIGLEIKMKPTVLEFYDISKADATTLRLGKKFCPTIQETFEFEPFKIWLNRDFKFLDKEKNINKIIFDLIIVNVDDNKINGNILQITDEKTKQMRQVIISNQIILTDEYFRYQIGRKKYYIGPGRFIATIRIDNLSIYDTDSNFIRIIPHSIRIFDGKCKNNMGENVAMQHFPLATPLSESYDGTEFYKGSIIFGNYTGLDPGCEFDIENGEDFFYVDDTPEIRAAMSAVGELTQV